MKRHPHVVIFSAAALILAGCSKETTGPPAHVPDKLNGQYIVEHVSDCAGCHSQTDQTGQPIPGKEFAGGVRFGLPFGAVYSRNLTPDPTHGIGSWTNQEIMDAFRTGHAPDSPTHPGTLFPIMPYWLYGYMTDNDAEDVVAFLRSLTPVAYTVPQDTLPPQFRVHWARQDSIPNATPATAQTARGKYLVQLAGCIECHTLLKAESTGNPALQGVDLRYFLAGGREFGPVQSKNITPDVTTGIGSWRTAQIDSAVFLGFDEHGHRICPPMPWPVYMGMTAGDRGAVLSYVKGIPPINHPVPEDTVTCQ